MISLIISLLVLVAGYLIYGRIVEQVFAPDDRKTPAYTKQDGVDFMPALDRWYFCGSSSAVFWREVSTTICRG